MLAYVNHETRFRVVRLRCIHTISGYAGSLFARGKLSGILAGQRAVSDRCKRLRRYWRSGESIARKSIRTRQIDAVLCESASISESGFIDGKENCSTGRIRTHSNGFAPAESRGQCHQSAQSGGRSDAAATGKSVAECLLPNRSGDFFMLQSPGWIEGRTKSTTHGSTYAYDTHVPFLLYGWGIKPGQTLRRTHIHDIAPTITALLSLLEPSGCIGNPVEEAMK